MDITGTEARTKLGTSGDADESVAQRVLRNLPYVGLSIGLLIGVWLFASHVLGVRAYIIPHPADVLRSLYQGLWVVPVRDGLLAPGGLYAPTWQTLHAAALGFVYGSAVGMALGGVVSQFELLEKLFRPYVTGFQSIPKVALAPLFIIWFGFGGFAQQMMAASLVVFPVFVNTVNGLQGVPDDRLQMARSFGASRWKVFSRVTVPSALPSIFTGLELAAVYALLGVIASQLLAGNTGLGAVILTRQTVSDTPAIFALLLISGVIGSLMHGLVRLVRRRAVFWEREA